MTEEGTRTMSDTRPLPQGSKTPVLPHGGLLLGPVDAPVALEALGHAAYPQLPERAESLLTRLSTPPTAEADHEAEQDPDEQRRLRTRLLYVLASTASPGQSDYAAADVLAAMPGDLCLIVTRW